MKRLTVLGMVLLAWLWGTGAWPEDHDRGAVYIRVNLVSDIAGVARFTDANLVNPWGLAFGPASPFWVADNGSGVSTLYNGRGQAFPIAAPLVVTIPSPTDSTGGGTPTGLVFNGTGEFVVSANGTSGSPSFLFATEDGTLLGWSPTVSGTQAIIVKDNSDAGAVYKGLAIASTPEGNFLYATNFSAGQVEMYDKDFTLKKMFTDPNVDPHFAPFGIQNIGGQLYVTFALQKPDKHDDQAGSGNGFVDVFNTDGTFVRQLAAHGPLNSPWGLALAPDGFGPFSHHLLVGNFGDGRINAFDVDSGAFDGQLLDPEGNPLTINGLWALQFGNGAPNGGSSDRLFFTAGIADESHGLFGFLRAGHAEEDAEE